MTTPVEIAVGGLLFDMDCVLVRSTHGDELCWIRWAAHHGLSDIFDLRRAYGRRAVYTIQEHLPDLSADSITEQLAQLDLFVEEEQSGVSAYPRVVALLASLPSYRWAVVTSASDKMMRSRLAAVGLPTPTHTVGGDTVSMGSRIRKAIFAVLKFSIASPRTVW